ncbi:helix-turn-helix domain-containing protein [Kitasatospora sp. NPDC001547]|uniref:helix-turn-helix domain-containing protein n=1 Tax=Kitasatospora sp. NPDC001547 TaxID=3364015 RepID=UPI0036CACB9B|nr:XRE family transcriptional regulator [Kitasatospora sp. Xyl93]
MNDAEESVRGVLAANLKRVRAQRGLSLSELSRQAGVGKATLSQLESGAGNPTLETVLGLSRVLGVPISDLVEARPADEVTVVRAADTEVLSGRGVDLRPLRRIECGDAVFEVYDQVVRIDGTQISAGHGGTEHTVVQAGRLRVRAGRREVELGPGDYVGFDAALPHSYTAVSGEPVRSVLLLQHRSEQRLHLAAATGDPAGERPQPGLPQGHGH